MTRASAWLLRTYGTGRRRERELLSDLLDDGTRKCQCGVPLDVKLLRTLNSKRSILYPGWSGIYPTALQSDTAVTYKQGLVTLPPFLDPGSIGAVL
jgi:hypothetical protein